MLIRVLSLMLVFCGIESTFAADSRLTLNLRGRSEIGEKTGRYQASTQAVTWDAKQTAIVVCDMWDRHTCPNAEQRVAQMAPRMNEVLKAAREKGVLIIHLSLIHI